MARVKQTAEKAGKGLIKTGKKTAAFKKPAAAFKKPAGKSGGVKAIAKAKRGKSLSRQMNTLKFVRALQYEADARYCDAKLLGDPDVGERYRCPQAKGLPVGGENGKQGRTKRVIKGLADGYTNPKTLPPSLITMLSEMSPQTRGQMRQACSRVSTWTAQVMAHLNNRASLAAQECLHTIKFALDEKNLKWEHVSACVKVVNKIVNMPQMDQKLLDKYMSELAHTGQIQGRLDGHNNASNSKLFDPHYTPNLGSRDQMKAAGLPCTSYPTRVRHGPDEFRLILQTNTDTEQPTGSNYVNVPGKGRKSYRFFQ